MTIRTVIQSHLSDILIEMTQPTLQQQADLRLRFIRYLLSRVTEDIDQIVEDDYIESLWTTYNELSR